MSIAVAIDLINKAEHGRYDDPRYSLAMLIASIILKMNGMGGEIKEIATESGAFSDMQSAVQKVDKAMSQIQTWQATHKDVSPGQAVQNEEYMKLVKNFKDAVKRMHDLTVKYGKNEKYQKDGMDEAKKTHDMIWDTVIPWKPDGTNMSIGQMINDKTGRFDKDLAGALFFGASKSTADSGIFHDWSVGGKGGASGTKDLATMLQNFTTTLNQDLNVKNTYLTQIHQTVSNDISISNRAIDTMIRNANNHA